MALQSVNPTDGSLLREYPETTPAEVAAALAAAPRAFESWRRASFAERAAVLGRAGALLRERRDALSRLMALEMGKPLAQGRAEADKCAWVCEHYAQHAERLLAPEDAPTDASKSYVAFEPLGPVLAVMPWNFPLWQVFRFAAPALMAGNVGLLKHASNVSGCALAIEGILHEAGLPRDAFRALLVGSSRVATLVEDPAVAAVTLTGSTPAGRAVAARAGACLKKTVLELGGSDPYVILEDADVEAAAETCAAARLVNGGQSCIAAKRFIVVEAVLQRLPGAPRRAGAGPAGWATRSRRARTWARRRGATFATSCTARSRRASPAAPGRSWAAASPAGPVLSTRRASSPGSPRACPPSTRSSSGRSRRSWPRGTSATRSGSPTRPSTASGRPSSRATSSAASASRATSSPPAPASSTPP